MKNFKNADEMYKESKENVFGMGKGDIAKAMNFVKEHGIASGGNWSAMVMKAIKHGLPKVFKEMPDREYEFEELIYIVHENIKVRLPDVELFKKWR